MVRGQTVQGERSGATGPERKMQGDRSIVNGPGQLIRPAKTQNDLPRPKRRADWPHDAPTETRKHSRWASHASVTLYPDHCHDRINSFHGVLASTTIPGCRNPMRTSSEGRPSGKTLVNISNNHVKRDVSISERNKLHHPITVALDSDSAATGHVQPVATAGHTLLYT